MDVGVILLDLLPEPHGLVVLGWVDVLGPAALNVVHALTEELGPLRVHLRAGRLKKDGGKNKSLDADFLG